VRTQQRHARSRRGWWRALLVALALLAPLVAIDGAAPALTTKPAGATLHPGPGTTRVAARAGQRIRDPNVPRQPHGPGVVTVPLDGRPFRLYFPSSYDPARPMPLVVVLHGYTASAQGVTDYFGLQRQAELRGFLYAMPDGTRDKAGYQFWNATERCCDHFDSHVDDSTYLSRLISLVKWNYAVDRRRVFLLGHSNGGFMAHRMACEHAGQITAIASFAGVGWQDETRCAPTRAVSVLQIHGTNDPTVAYQGGTTNNVAYPGAEEMVARWRRLNGCALQDTPAPRTLDLDAAVVGAETLSWEHRDGCRDGSRVQLWRMAGSGHLPPLTPSFTAEVIDFFYDSRHPA